MIITKAFIFAVAAIAPVFSLPLPASVYEPGIWWPTSNQEWSEHWATSTQASSASHPTLHNLNPNAHGGQSHPIPSQSLLPNSSPPSNTPPGHHGGGTAPSTHLVSHSNQHPNLPVGTTAPHVDSESQPQAGGTWTRCPYYPQCKYEVFNGNLGRTRTTEYVRGHVQNVHTGKDVTALNNAMAKVSPLGSKYSYRRKVNRGLPSTYTCPIPGCNRQKKLLADMIPFDSSEGLFTHMTKTEYMRVGEDTVREHLRNVFPDWDDSKFKFKLPKVKSSKSQKKVASNKAASGSGPSGSS